MRIQEIENIAIGTGTSYDHLAYSTTTAAPEWKRSPATSYMASTLTST